MLRSLTLSLVLLAVSGCGNPRAQLSRYPEAEITTAEQVRDALVSPEFVALYFGLPILLEEPDPDAGECPARVELGEAIVWVGGCVDEHGREWAPGGKWVRRRADEVRGAYREFPFELTGRAASGRVRIWRRGDETRFSVKMRLDGDRMVVVYEGRTTADLLDEEHHDEGPSEWSGVGTIATAEHGKVEILTFAKVHDRSVCRTEPVSGITKLRAGGHTALIRYDGAFDCDPDGRAEWSLDGVPMGEIDVASLDCSLTDEPRGWSWLAVVFAAVLVVGGRRHRPAGAGASAQSV